MKTLAVPSRAELEEQDPAARAAAASARRTIANEIAGLQMLSAALEGDFGRAFSAAVDAIGRCKGRVIVTGVGKSGHIGAKVSATLASTGTPAQFVHAGEAGHGDLGMIAANDIIVALSWSGESREFAPIITYAKRFRVPLIAITARRGSALGRAADVALVLPKADEACPHGLAPTTSTMLQLAVGDALAIAMLEARGFTPQDFKIFHPGGRLGASLQFVRDIMHTGDGVPIAPVATPMSEAIILMSEKGFGSLGVVDDFGHLIGIITDGDLRRHLNPDLLGRPVDAVMSPNPKTIGPDAVVASALEILNSSKISTLFVVEGARPVGIVHMHDLLRAGVA